MKIGIIGTGFVGLSLAAVLSNKGYQIHAVDLDKNKVNKIKQGIAPFYEPNLDKLLKKQINKNLKVSSDFKKAINQCKIIFVTIGTPTNRGKIDLSNIKKASSEIGIYLKTSSNRPILIIKSTVTPGTNKEIKTIIEKKSDKKEGRDFSILSNPEFLREGKAIEDTENPHIVVIGGNNNKAIDKLKNLYEKIYRKDLRYVITNPQTAELIKYANNAFLATKISFINQISEICQSLDDVNVDEVANAIGVDPRIGNQFLMAGPGYGGSCLPKDLQALISYSSDLGKRPHLLQAVKKINSSQIGRIIEILRNEFDKLNERNISVLGLAFKENTDDIRESVSIKLVKQLLSLGCKIKVHDPMALENTKNILKNKVTYCNSINDVLENSECAIIMTAWDEYKKLKPSSLNKMKNRLIIDTRRILFTKKLNSKYYALGA